MMKNRFTGVFIFVFSIAAAQQRTDTLRLFYNINESGAERHTTRVDSFLGRLSSFQFSISITGYADFLNSAQYNIALSGKRAKNIRSYINSRWPAILVTSTESKGERLSADNGSTKGEPYQRRVELVAKYIKIPDKKNIARTPPVIHEEMKQLKNLKRGESLDLEGLSFVPGRHQMLPGSKLVLNQLLKTMKEHPDLKIEIRGHVCCTEGDEDGIDLETGEKKLSHNRAKAVFTHLVENGIGADRLKYKGLGHSQPKIASESTPEEEQVNRRVEIKVLDN